MAIEGAATLGTVQLAFAVYRRSPVMRAFRRPVPLHHDRLLTEAEFRVAAVLKEGLPNERIAARLNRSIYTVKNQVASILRKMNVPSRARVIALLHGAPAAPTEFPPQVVWKLLSPSGPAAPATKTDASFTEGSAMD